MPNNIKLQLWDWMRRFLEDKLVFGRTFRDSEFFYKFLLQPWQPSFNHLDSGPEGSAAIPTGNPRAPEQQLIRINPALPGAPCTSTAQGYSTCRLGSRAGSPPRWALQTLHPHFLQGQLQSLYPTREFCLRDRILWEHNLSPDYVPTKSPEGFPSSFSWEVLPGKDTTAVCSQPGIRAVIDFYCSLGIFLQRKKGLKKLIFHTNQTFP